MGGAQALPCSQFNGQAYQIAPGDIHRNARSQRAEEYNGMDGNVQPERTEQR